jgi:riboflavin kinase/FMN adenylyltransferase
VLPVNHVLLTRRHVSPLPAPHRRPPYPSRLPPRPSILTIGTFDGVHRGHAALLSRAADLRASSHPAARIIALTFDPHPATTLKPEAVPPRLTTFPQREALLRTAGADEVVRLHPTPDLLSQTPEAFIQTLVATHHPVAFVEGPDFRFGRARAGDLNALRRLGQQHNFSAHVVDPVTVALDDCTIVPASSTIARWLLHNARVRDAALVLGHPYELTGTVIQGDRRGRTIGFPTANLATDQLIPADGVYAARAILPDGRTLTAALSIGTKPTFGPHARTVEAFIMTDNDSGTMGGTGVPPVLSEPHTSNPETALTPSPSLPLPLPPSHLPGLPEYDWPLRLELHSWIRDQLKFESLDTLVAQMHRDCARIRTIIESPTPDPHRPELAACR